MPIWLPSWAVKLAAGLVLAVLLFAGGWFKGSAHVQVKWDAEHAAMALAAAKQAQNQAEATVAEVTKYVDRVKVVREHGATIIKEVPIYVPAQADADCTINAGFVRLHDAAAANTLPSAAGSADAAPSGVKLSTVAETVADNYQRCHENAEQLMALQKWTMAMGAATP